MDSDEKTEVSFDDLRTDYFSAFGRFELKNGRWFAEGRVYRRDSGEAIVARFVSGQDYNEVLRHLSEKLKLAIQGLAIPQDWGSRVRPVLRQDRRLHRKIAEFGRYIAEMLPKEVDEHEVALAFSVFVNNILKDAIEIARQIEQLDGQERLALLACEDSVYQNAVGTAANLDEITAKEQVFDFFLSPSDEERLVHEKHVARIRSVTEGMSENAAEKK